MNLRGGVQLSLGLWSFSRDRGRCSVTVSGTLEPYPKLYRRGVAKKALGRMYGSPALPAPTHPEQRSAVIVSPQYVTSTLMVITQCSSFLKSRFLTSPPQSGFPPASTWLVVAGKLSTFLTYPLAHSRPPTPYSKIS